MVHAFAIGILFAVIYLAAAVIGLDMTIAEPPCDPKATPEVKKVLAFLRESQGKNFISGQTDHPDALWIEQNTGRKPVILGLDFMHAPARMNGKEDNVSRAIDWVKKEGGLVTFQWHWVSPTGTQDMGGGFYTKNSTFDLAKTLANPKSTDYTEMVKDIDDVADQLKLLQKAGVPVIFRPLHEAQGTWFWWGAKGAKPCVDLYLLIFDRMTKKHGLHNLIWAWTAYPASQGKGDPAEWYPGDKYVDLVVSDYCEKEQDYRDLVTLTKGKKMVGLAETMNAPDPSTALTKTPWAYWVTWARRDWNQNSPADMKKAMANPKTLHLGNIPKLFKKS